MPKEVGKENRKKKTFFCLSGKTKKLKVFCEKKI